jgi:hypothetical protein
MRPRAEVMRGDSLRWPSDSLVNNGDATKRVSNGDALRLCRAFGRHRVMTAEPICGSCPMRAIDSKERLLVLRFLADLFIVRGMLAVPLKMGRPGAGETGASHGQERPGDRGQLEDRGQPWSKTGGSEISGVKAGAEPFESPSILLRPHLGEALAVAGGKHGNNGWPSPIAVPDLPSLLPTMSGGDVVDVRAGSLHLTTSRRALRGLCRRCETTRTPREHRCDFIWFNRARNFETC